MFFQELIWRSNLGCYPKLLVWSPEVLSPGSTCFVRWLVSWLDCTACQALGYFIPKTFLFYSFFVEYGSYLCSYLYIISGDSFVDD